jgi:hypothetical protein
MVKKMNDQDIIKAIAELDGWMPKDCENDYIFVKQLGNSTLQVHETNLPPYLTSRDAIVPLINRLIEERKLTGTQLGNFFKWTGAGMMSVDYQNYIVLLKCEPLKLCKALLRATGKWIEAQVVT